MPTILIVEDDPDLLFLYEIAFSQKNYESIAAPDARAAIFQLENTPIDVVILDLNLPDAHGSVVVEHAVNSDILRPDRFIVVSANEQWSDRLRELGVKNYLVKPVPTSTIIETIDALL